MNPTTAETIEEIKARGGFYTPPEVTAFLSAWSIRSADERALEPSCGDGAFMVAGAVRYAQLERGDLSGHFYGIEMEEGEAEKSRRLVPTAVVRTSSFFDVGSADMPTVDAVFGNPPYIRYHGFTGEHRKAGLARAAAQGVKLSQLASSWAHFVIHSTAFLPENGGRIALVLPAELLHTDYAEPVREFLTTRFSSVVVIAFDRPLFNDAEVDAVLLLASNDDVAGMRLIRAHDAAALATLDIRPVSGVQKRAYVRRWSATIDADAERIYRRLLESDSVERLGSLASIDIGVVTGNNGYFIMSAVEARARKLPRTLLTPIVHRPADVPGLIVRSAETRLLLDLRGRTLPRSAGLKAYLDQGQADEVDHGYKCRTRKPWFAVPLPRVRPDAFVPYMNHHAPRLIVNAPDAWSTNLVHGAAFRNNRRNVCAVAAAMLSSVTMLSSEIEGRAYGGGVLKLETKEAERLLVPIVSDAQEEALVAAFDALDHLVRAGKLAEASLYVDKILDIDHELYHVAFQVFRSRRLERKLTGPTQAA